MLKVIYTTKTCKESQSGGSKIRYIAPYLDPQGTCQVEINNCMGIIIFKSVGPVILADAGCSFLCSSNYLCLNLQIMQIKV